MVNKRLFGEPTDTVLRNIKGNLRIWADDITCLRGKEAVVVPERQQVLERVRSKVQSRLGKDFKFGNRFCYIGHGPDSWEYFVKLSLEESGKGDYYSGETIWKIIEKDTREATELLSSYAGVFLYPCLDKDRFAKVASLASTSSAVFGVNWDDQVNFTKNEFWVPSWPFIDCHLSQRSRSGFKYSGIGLNWLFFPEGGHWINGDMPKDFEPGLVYVGNLLGNKSAVLDKLNYLSKEFRLFGPGTGNGTIDPILVPDLYRRYTASLALSGAGWGYNVTHLKCRHFEIPCSGGLLFTEYTKDLNRVFDIGNEIVAFKSSEEALQLYQWLINNPDKAMRIRKNGHLRAKEHSWSNRLTSVLTELDTI